MNEQFKDVFIEEVRELLADLEDKLLELEKEPKNKELLDSVFRVMHTIKGSSAMFGFEEISSFTHKLENLYDVIREGKLLINKAIIDITLESRDLILIMAGLSLPDGQDIISESDMDDAKKRVLEFCSTLVEDSSSDKESAKEIEIEEDSGNPLTTYKIFFKPHKEIFKQGTRPEKLIQEMEELGVVSINVIFNEIPAIENLTVDQCFLAWDILVTTRKDINELRDVFIFIENESEIKIEELHIWDESEDIAENELAKLGEILISKGLADPQQISEALHEQRRLGEVLIEKKVVKEDDVKTALTEQEHYKKLKDIQKKDLGSSTIRVDSEKLDHLVDLVGELVTVQARLAQLATQLDNTEVSGVSEMVERLTSELRDNAMSMRMLPIGTTFSKFKRLVRDLSLEMGKNIELVTEGSDTELDKTVIEKLNDPLIHLIRNSIDHGIEKPTARREKGKSEKGVLKLSAFHSGANVVIQIHDDGKGLDKDAIVRKAVDKQIISSSANMSDDDIFSLIFNAGFSTAEKVTSVSGRGVGMDVVKRQIESLGGIINIKSRKDKGTTIELQLPLTLAIIEGLLVELGDEKYVIPLATVDSCLEIEESQLSRGERHIINLRGKVLPYVELRSYFKMEGQGPEFQNVVIINTKNQQIGLVVDRVIGDYQTVIKGLGRLYKDVPGVSGATILGDGNVALILDPNKLSQVSINEEQHFVHNHG